MERQSFGGVEFVGLVDQLQYFVSECLGFSHQIKIYCVVKASFLVILDTMRKVRSSFLQIGHVTKALDRNSFLRNRN